MQDSAKKEAPQKERNLMIMGDAPHHETGFARVCSNLGKRWRSLFDNIDYWGIGYTGWPHDQTWLRHVYPGGGGEDWMSTKKLQAFLNVICAKQRGYTHVWMLQDHFMLSGVGFPKSIQDACRMMGMRSFMYVPVDAAIEREWLEIVIKVDKAVAYTEFGRDMIVRGLEGQSTMGGNNQYPIAMMPCIPHGTDAQIYRPLDDTNEVRQRLFQGWAKKHDFLILCVSANQRRKAHWHTLQTLSEIKKLGVKNVKLAMHMPPKNSTEGFDLGVIARQFGLVEGIDWIADASCFTEGGHAKITEYGLNEFYNAADLVMTSSLGEGWGLTITEALLAGTHVAAPFHTAIGEIAYITERHWPGRMIELPLSGTAACTMFDNNRVRFPIDVVGSAKVIADHIAEHRNSAQGIRGDAPEAIVEWLNWNRIAKEWLKVFGFSDDEIRDRYQDL